MKDALDGLRARLPEGERIDYAELVKLGAEVKARRLETDEAANREALKRVAERIRTGSFPYRSDVAAADEVKHLKLIPQYE